jgi:amino acid adenylation domain-containing protein
MKLPNVEDIYPLSPMQEGMLFHRLYNPDSEAYFIQMGCRLRGTLVTSAFRKAWEEVVRRHPVLRTGFLWDGLKKPMQVVRKSVDLPWCEEDWQGLSEPTQKARWEEFLQQDRKQGFDFIQPPLLRVALMQTSEESYYFAWSFHHILLDGWCRQMIIQEVFKFYEAYSQGRELKLDRPRPYREYIAWLQKQNEQEAETFWREELSGFIDPTMLGIEQVKPGIAEDDEAHEVIVSRLDENLTQRLEHLARTQQVTLNTIVHGAWGILLAHYSGTKDVVFGATVSGRQTPVTGIDTMMGMFINTLPVRVQIKSDEEVGGYLKRLQRHMAAAREYEYFPMVKVQGWSELPPGMPLFETFVVFENYPIDSSAQTQVGAAIKFEEMQAFETNTFPLVLAVIPGRSMKMSSSFSPRIFNRESVNRLLEHFEVVLDGITDRAGRIGEISLLRETERQQILVEWNQTQRSYPAQSVPQLFEDQVGKTPDVPAIVWEGERLTYEELNQQANQLARYLTELGVGPEVSVGICVERGIPFVIGALAILKAGGAYVPLDPSHPAELLETMLSEAHVSIVVAQNSTRDVISSAAGLWTQIVSLDGDRDQVASQSVENLAADLGPDNLAYVMYTSGSTGQPKGIAILHQAIVRLVINTNYVHLTGSDRIAQIATTSFDAATFEIWGALLNGACVVVLDRETSLNPVKLEQAIGSEKITVIFLTTALFNQIVRESQGAFRSLRYLLFGGEAVDKQWVEAVLRGGKPGHFLHVYGPTEMTTFTTSYEIIPTEGNETVPIGGPIANTEVYVLDEEMEPVPVGVTGELYAGGPGTARGYLNRPELTAEKFVPHPFAQKPGERLYRTGDRVRRRIDGNIEFIGRRDTQVKMRGFRIELGEIETALMNVAKSENVVVMMREDRPGDKQLVAYVAMPRQADTHDLKQALRQRLPEYMVPSEIVIMESLPLTRNGKIDRGALPAPSTERNTNGGEQRTVRTPVEDLIVQIWEEVLQVHPIGVMDNFFGLGGHSLLATQVVLRMNTAFHFDIPLRLVFEYPVVAELACQIEELMQGGARQDAPPIQRVPRTDDLPLSYAQQRLWFIEQLEPGRSTYNVPAAVRIQGDLDVAALEQAFSEIVQRHEPLRTRFGLVAGEPRQIIETNGEFHLLISDLTSVPASDREEQAKLLIREDAKQPFDLGRDRLMRVRLLRLAPEDHVLAVTMHHIVCDGWSIGILMREVSALYAAFSAGKASPLEELPIQYVDYSVWQRQWLDGEIMDRQLNYWREQLAGAEILDLPTDRSRPAIQSQRGERMQIALPPELTAKIRALGRANAATLYMTLLAAFQVLLYRYSGQENFAVGSPIAGRRRTETEGLIGFFVNTLVLRARLNSQSTFSELLQEVKEVTLGAYTHQDVPFEKLVEELQPKRDLSRSPLFQVLFVLQNAPLSDLEFGVCKLLPFSAVQASAAKFELTLDFWDLESGVQGSLEYNTDLFDSHRISRMLGHYQVVLNAMVNQPEQIISEFSILTEQERQQLLVDWNRTEADCPRGKCVHELFEEQARQTPKAVAVEYEDQWLSYTELDQRGNQLACYLQRLGVRPEVKVGICMERSLEMVIAHLAILKAGGAYVPLDPNHPAQRLSCVVSDSNLGIILAHAATAGCVAETKSRIVCLDSNWGKSAGDLDASPVYYADPAYLAYVMYTSGSTGVPKAVGVTHGNIVRMLYGNHFADFSGGRKFLQFVPITFDVSALEIWGCLLNGGTLAVFKGGTAELGDLADFIERRAVDTAWLTSGLFHQILEHTGEKLRGVRQLLVGGDVVSPTWARKALHSAPGQVLINGYGPTENTMLTTAHRMEKVEDVGYTSVLIGKPVPSTEVYVLDKKMGLVPVGVPGELYAGGEGLARGYLNSPELTAAKFVPNPFSRTPGERLYRTGDLVRWINSGNLEFIKRLDHQVKVRGFRIELGEIETALERLKGVEQAVVITRDNKFAEKQLLAYIVTSGEISISSLREKLREQLPDYMIPAHFVKLDTVPLTSNGKIDRQSLPSPVNERVTPGKDYAIPQTPLERELATIWSELLELRQVSIHDDFFEIGGHSLLAVRMRSMVEDRLKRDMALRDLFRAPTIAGLARLLEQASDPTASPILVEIQPHGSRTPFFAVHPVGGNVLCYAELARELGPEQPFYGLQAPSPVLLPENPSLEQMAELYIKEIRSVQPSGPYLLGGWSLGGLVAWEIARQLKAQSETIGLLTLIDSYPPVGTSSGSAFQDFPVLPWFARDMANLVGRDPETAREAFEQLGPDEQWRMVQDALVQYGVVAERNAHAEMSRLLEIFTRNIRAMSRYSMNPAAQNVLLLAATEGQVPEQLVSQWKQWAGGGVEFHLLPGNHYSIIRRPNVTVIAEALQCRLNAFSEHASRLFEEEQLA